jgi:hypothetical protein
MDVDSTLTYRFFCRLDDGHHWQDDLHHYFDFCLFKNLEHFKLFGGHGPRKRSYAGLVFFSCITPGKAETHNHEMAQSCVIFARPFCRNQPIRRMSRV